MGSWGIYNFDNDTACDQLYEMVNPLIEQIRKTASNPTQMEPDEATSSRMMCNLEILLRLAEGVRDGEQNVIADLNYGNILPSKQEIAKWRDDYLRVFLEYCPKWDPSVLKSGRLEVIQGTFGRLIQLAHDE